MTATRRWRSIATTTTSTAFCVCLLLLLRGVLLVSGLDDATGDYYYYYYYYYPSSFYPRGGSASAETTITSTTATAETAATKEVPRPLVAAADVRRKGRTLQRQRLEGRFVRTLDEEDSYDDIPPKGNPDSTAGGKVPTSPPPPDNQVLLTVYVALLPQQQSQGFDVANVISGYLNATNPQFVILLDERRRQVRHRRRQLQKLRGRQWRLEGNDEDEDDGNGEWTDDEKENDDEDDDNNYSVTIPGEGGASDNTNIETLELHYRRTDTETFMYQQGDQWHWWKHDLVYDCFFRNSVDDSWIPVTNVADTNAIQQQLYESFDQGMETGQLNEYMWNTNTTFGALDMTTNPDEVSVVMPQPEHENQVVLTVYIAFLPTQLSLRDLVTSFLSNYIEEMYPEQALNMVLRSRSLQGQVVGNGNSVRLISHKGWDMAHQGTSGVDTVRKGAFWWWEYDIGYDCSWTESQEPITNQTLLADMTAEMIQIVQDGVTNGSIYEWLGNHSSYDALGVLNITTNSQDVMVGDVDNTGSDASDFDSQDKDDTFNIPESQMAEYSTPLDPSEWDWRRYLGLGLFVGTILVTFVLMQVATCRRRELKKKELWGDLATERGVDELLRTGWKLRDNQMEIFDKKKLGYDDEQGSMFIGGFEQREAPTEITLTRPESMTTRETHHFPFSHGTGSECTPTLEERKPLHSNAPRAADNTPGSEMTPETRHRSGAHGTEYERTLSVEELKQPVRNKARKAEDGVSKTFEYIEV